MKTAEMKIAFIITALNILAFIMFVVNSVFNMFDLYVVAFASVTAISLTNIANDLYQYNNSNMPRLDRCRLFGLGFSILLFFSCMIVLMVSTRVGFDNSLLIIVSETVFSSIGLLLITNHCIRAYLIIADELYVSRKHDNSELSRSIW